MIHRLKNRYKGYYRTYGYNKINRLVWVIKYIKTA